MSRACDSLNTLTCYLADMHRQGGPAHLQSPRHKSIAKQALEEVLEVGKRVLSLQLEDAHLLGAERDGCGQLAAFSLHPQLGGKAVLAEGIHPPAGYD